MAEYLNIKKQNKNGFVNNKSNLFHSKKMLFNHFVLTVWFMTLAMLISILNIDPSTNFGVPPQPNHAGFVVAWFFICSSFAIFSAGMFTMLTSS